MPNRRSRSIGSTVQGSFPVGCVVEFVIKSHVFWVDVSPTRVKLWTASADDADGLRNRYLVHDGDASDAKSWESLLIEIGHVEKFGVYINHADTLRNMWTRMAHRARSRTRGAGLLYPKLRDCNLDS